MPPLGVLLSPGHCLIQAPKSLFCMMLDLGSDRVNVSEIERAELILCDAPRRRYRLQAHTPCAYFMCCTVARARKQQRVSPARARKQQRVSPARARKQQRVSQARARKQQRVSRAES
jgi:hypothetical protein